MPAEEANVDADVRDTPDCSCYRLGMPLPSGLHLSVKTEDKMHEIVTDHICPSVMRASCRNFLRDNLGPHDELRPLLYPLGDGVFLEGDYDADWPLWVQDSSLVVAAVIRQWVTEPGDPKLAEAMQKQPDWVRVQHRLREVQSWLQSEDINNQGASDTEAFFKYLVFMQRMRLDKPATVVSSTGSYEAVTLLPSDYIPCRSKETTIRFEAAHLLRKLNFPATPDTVDFLLSTLPNQPLPIPEVLPARGVLVTTFCFEHSAIYSDSLYDEYEEVMPRGTMLTSIQGAGGMATSETYQSVMKVQSAHRTWWEKTSGSTVGVLNLIKLNKGRTARISEEEQDVELYKLKKITFTELLERCYQREVLLIKKTQKVSENYVLPDADQKRIRHRIQVRFNRNGWVVS